jgi:predicted ATPase
MEHYQGRLASSLACCERATALYDPAQYEGRARMIGAEEGVVALGVAGWNLWQLGYPDAALARAQAAVALARRLHYPFSLAFALFFEIVVRWNRDRQGSAALQERLAEVVALSEAQGFRLWLGISGVFGAAARVTDGDSAALAEIMDNLAIAGETESQAGAPALMLILADAQRAAGQIEAARGTVAAALAYSAQTGQPFWDADLHRLDGDLLLATSSAGEALDRYQRALAIAREQDARSLELRAAMSLARLWRDQGRRPEARDVLAPVYSWFTEGLDTRDLIDGKALLEDLSR